MTLAEKLNKYFGPETGVWWCKFKGCHSIFSVIEIKNNDKGGLISWIRPDKNSNLIFPMCPIHGGILTFTADTDDIEM